ncbi:MAG TPA: phosphoribosylanthranilate isomerase [Desulfotomaculum sp.]|nr:phosphoribosylanthranilate isomerase [Desulfotomaculum sp.]
MVWVKICGLTDLDTALFVAGAGADAVGFVFAASVRQVSPDLARSISRALPSFIMKIGVFVNAPLSEVQNTARYCQLDAVQLHGTESPEYCRSVGWKTIKAFSVGGGLSLKMISDFSVDAVLLDTYVPDRAGGTGETFDWETAKELGCARPLILAGGLTPANVAGAIRAVQPYGVDVSSGVETDGKKDREKIRQFIKMAKEVV